MPLVSKMRDERGHAAERQPSQDDAAAAAPANGVPVRRYQGLLEAAVASIEGFDAGLDNVYVAAYVSIDNAVVVSNPRFLRAVGATDILCCHCVHPVRLQQR